MYNWTTPQCNNTAQLTSVWTVPAPLHAPAVAAHYSRPSYWHSPHISKGQRATRGHMDQSKTTKIPFSNQCHYRICCSAANALSSNNLSMGNSIHLSSEQTERIYNLDSCLILSVDRRDIKKHIKRQNTNTSSRRHTHSHTMSHPIKAGIDQGHHRGFLSVWP